MINSRAEFGANSVPRVVVRQPKDQTNSRLFNQTEDQQTTENDPRAGDKRPDASSQGDNQRDRKRHRQDKAGDILEEPNLKDQEHQTLRGAQTSIVMFMDRHQGADKNGRKMNKQRQEQAVPSEVQQTARGRQRQALISSRRGSENQD